MYTGHGTKIIDKELRLHDKGGQRLKSGFNNLNHNHVCFHCMTNNKQGGKCPTCPRNMVDVGMNAVIPIKSKRQWKAFRKRYNHLLDLNVIPDDYKWPEQKYNFNLIEYTASRHCRGCDHYDNADQMNEYFSLSTMSRKMGHFTNHTESFSSKFFCPKCFDIIEKYWCSKQADCKPCNKNKFKVSDKCPKCLSTNWRRFRRLTRRIKRFSDLV